MKIIFIGPAHPYRGGIAAFSERLAHEFQAQGYDVEIETFTLQYPSFLFPGTTQYTDAPAPQDLRIQRSVLIWSLSCFGIRLWHLAWVLSAGLSAATRPPK